jgi:hypothetical protein
MITLFQLFCIATIVSSIIPGMIADWRKVKQLNEVKEG